MARWLCLTAPLLNPNSKLSFFLPFCYCNFCYNLFNHNARTTIKFITFIIICSHVFFFIYLFFFLFAELLLCQVISNGVKIMSPQLITWTIYEFYCDVALLLLLNWSLEIMDNQFQKNFTIYFYIFCSIN